MLSEIQRPPIEAIDLSVDRRLLQKAKTLMGKSSVTPESARKWIESPVKALWERVIFGGLGSILTSPVVGLALAGIAISDGTPFFYPLKVGFLGKDNKIVHVGRYLKLRSLQKGVDLKDKDTPFGTTAFQGGRKKEQPNVDLRVHSKIGAWIRKKGIDEFPQLWPILLGNVAGVSPRAYTFLELEGLRQLFEWHDKYGNVFPEDLPKDIRETVSSFRIIKPGFLSLYTATLKKDLTISERLTLDYMYLTGANPAADLRIIKASIETALAGVGSR